MTTEEKRVPKTVLYLATAFFIYVTIYTLGTRIDIFTTAFDLITEKYPFLYFYGFLVAGAGVIGLMMIIISRRELKKPDVILLALMMMALVASAFMNSDSGVKENLSGVTTVGVTVVTFYLLGKCFSKKDMHFLLTRVILWASVIWNYGCIVSLGMYMVCYSGYYKFAGFARRSRMGLMEGRLFGCFSDPNYAAMIAMLIGGGLVYIYIKHSRENTSEDGKKPLWLYAERIYIVFSILMYLFYTVLAQSRSTETALIVTGIIFVLLSTYHRRKNPELFKKLPLVKGGVLRAYGVRILAMLVAMVVIYFGVMFGLQGIGVLVVPDRDTTAELERDDVSLDDISNSRFDIWVDYLTLVKDRPVFGLSIRGALPYAKKVDPEGYLAMTEHNPHSVFILSAVQGGVVGFLLLIVFIVRAFVRIWKCCKGEKPPGMMFVLFLFIILIYGVYCVFNVGFFVTTCFEAALAWTALGFLEKKCEATLKKGEKQIGNKIA